MDSAAAIGWYGPLIDLSSVPDHAGGGYVQLLVLVHRTRPLLQVGDETVLLFHISYPQPRHIQNQKPQWPPAAVARGDVALFRNVNIVAKDGGKPSFEAAVTDVSSVLVLVSGAAARGDVGVVPRCRVGLAVRGKLERVVAWARETRSSEDGFTRRNWKLREHRETVRCDTIAQVWRLVDGSNKHFNASFRAGIDQILLPSSGGGEQEPARSSNLGFFPLRPVSSGEGAVNDLICLGCKRCNRPLTPSSAWRRQRDETPAVASTLLCLESSDRAHLLCAIYKPFLMYVSDRSAQLPVLVRNKAAEVMFGNVTAEKVSECCKRDEMKEEEGQAGDWKHHPPEFYRIWLILLRSLLVPGGRNSPFRFEVAVDPDTDPLDGGFELVGFAMPTPVEASVTLPPAENHETVVEGMPA